MAIRAACASRGRTAGAALTMTGGLVHTVKNLLLSIAATLLCLILIEGVLRSTHLFDARVSWSEPDEHVTYRFVPGARYWNRLEGGGSSGRINSTGWRDTEWTLEKRPGSTRVAVVGDSYVEAFQVELAETFPKRAEEILSRRGRRVELMNFGRGGFTTSEELLVIRDVVTPFHPDLVVLFFFPGNDIRDVTRELAPDAMRPFFLLDAEDRLTLDTTFNATSAFRARRLINPLKTHSALISLLTERYNVMARRRSGGDDRTLVPTGYLSLCTLSPDPRYVRAFRLNQRLIREIAGVVGPSHLLLVTMESPGWKPEEEQVLKSQAPSFNPFFFEETLERFSRQEGIGHLGLETAFRKDWLENRRPLHWTHWNPTGHALVGNLLADRLESILPAAAGG